MSESIRCFIAIEIPEPIQNELVRIQERLRCQIEKASWVKPGNIHLTLKFLGDINPENIESIGKAVEEVASRHYSFLLHIGGIGAFPNLARPRVIWAGVRVGVEHTSALAEAINLALSKHGFPLETKKFNPHLSIGRLREKINLKPYANQYLQYDSINGAEMTVGAISLIRSQLDSRVAIYSTLQSYLLRQH